MHDPPPVFSTRLAYALSQLSRLAWYAGHEVVLRRLAAGARRRPDKNARPPAQSSVPPPTQRRIYADMLALLRQDLANVEAGIYPLPQDRDGSLLTRLYRSRLFFDDLPEIHRRRERNGFREVLSEKAKWGLIPHWCTDPKGGRKPTAAGMYTEKIQKVRKNPFSGSPRSKLPMAISWTGYSFWGCSGPTR